MRGFPDQGSPSRMSEAQWAFVCRRGHESALGTVDNSKAKRRSSPGLRFHPDRTSQSFNYLLAESQTDSRAGDLVRMQMREKSKYTGVDAPS